MTSRLNQVALFLLLIAGVSSAGKTVAQDFERYRPRNLNTPRRDQPRLTLKSNEATGSEKVLVESLDAVKILDSKDKVQANESNSDAAGLLFDFDDQSSLVYSDQFNAIVSNYINQPISLRRLNELSREIIQFYRNSDQPIVDVQIPEQKITGGTVQIVIVETRISSVVMESGPHFDPDVLKKWIWSTQQGSKVYESSLVDDLFWLNQSSFRRVEVDLKPGEQDGTTDVFFRSNEVLPWRSYVGYEDSGVRSLDLERLYGGIIWGNAFGRDGTLSYQYTANAEFDKIHAHAATWLQPFNRLWSGQTSGSWAGFSPDIPGALSQQGESWQVSTSLIRHLVKNQNDDISLSVGSDFKSTNNNLEFGGVSVLATNADLVNVRLGMRAFHRYETGEYFLISNDVFVSPGNGFSSANNTAAFNTIRAGTSTDYVYNRLRTEGLFDMGDFQLVAKSVAQYSSNRLLFSETLGLGGYDSVRGYDQRVFSGDSGWISSLEFGPKPIEMGTLDNPGSLTLFSFIDAGKAYTRDARPGEINDLFLMSVGVGTRWAIDQNSSLRVDYGHGIEKAPNIATRDRLHVGYVTQFGPRPSRN